MHAVRIAIYLLAIGLRVVSRCAAK